MEKTKNNGQVTPRVCSYQRAILLDNCVRKLLQNPEKIIKDYVNQGDTVMDMGCGPGFFTVEMAKLVGINGKVVAADLQQEMLDYTKRKALKYGLDSRILYHKCAGDKIGFDLNVKVDFILANYMVHEIPGTEFFFKELKAIMNAGGKLLIIEPKIHVSKKTFDNMVLVAQKVGFKIFDTPSKKGGRAILLVV